MHNSLEEYGWYRELSNPTRRIVSESIHEIDNDFGSIEELESGLYRYHNGLHTRMVCEDVAVLKDALGLTNNEFEIAISAASTHDKIKTFDRSLGVDEVESSEWLASRLANIPSISRVGIESGRLAIIGTTPRFHGGTIIQKAMEQDYPNKRAELIAHTVAGADVGRLFTPEGPLLAHRLFEEQQVSSDKEVSLQNLTNFQDSQIEFLVNYKYPSRDIETAMATHKTQVIRYLGKISTMLQQGLIYDWDQLILLDKQFKEFQGK